MVGNAEFFDRTWDGDAALPWIARGGCSIVPTLLTAGEAGRSPLSWRDGEAGLGVAAATLATIGFVNSFPAVLVEGTRLSLSSSCVRSLADMRPIYAQILSPVCTYASLKVM